MMRCQRCGRLLLRPGIQVQEWLNGPMLTVGPVCAQQMGHREPDPKRSAVAKVAALFRRSRNVKREEGQMALFGETA